MVTHSQSLQAADKVQKAPSNEVKKERHYYIDWLRSCDVHVVVLLHSIYTTDVVTGHSKHDHIWKEKMDFIFRYLAQIGIPVFFLISGMGSIYF